MDTPFAAGAESYSWLDDEAAGLVGVASCFTFLRPATSHAVRTNGALQDVRDVDLSGADDAVDVMVAEGDGDTAVFDAANGWTVVYQHDCTPDQFANTLLESSAIDEGVVVFWDVNAVTEFSWWQRGRQVVTFRDAHDRQGTEPDRLNAVMAALRIPVVEPADEDVESGDDWFATYSQLMALAESITGVRLGPDFLARPLHIGQSR